LDGRSSTANRTAGQQTGIRSPGIMKDAGEQGKKRISGRIFGAKHDNGQTERQREWFARLDEEQSGSDIAAAKELAALSNQAKAVAEPTMLQRISGMPIGEEAAIEDIGRTYSLWSLTRALRANPEYARKRSSLQVDELVARLKIAKKLVKKGELVADALEKAGVQLEGLLKEKATEVLHSITHSLDGDVLATWLMANSVVGGAIGAVWSYLATGAVNRMAALDAGVVSFLLTMAWSLYKDSRN